MENFAVKNLGSSLDETDRIRGFATGDEMEAFFIDNHEEVWAGVSFYYLIII